MLDHFGRSTVAVLSGAEFVFEQSFKHLRGALIFYFFIFLGWGNGLFIDIIFFEGFCLRQLQFPSIRISLPLKVNGKSRKFIVESKHHWLAHNTSEDPKDQQG